MKKWKLVLSQGLLAGSLASLISTAVLALAGRRESGSAAAPLNAVSHWYWGDEALRQQQADLAHTAAGYLTHHVAATFWATLYAALASNRPALRTTPGVVLGAAATSATACLVDFNFTPQRFTPGYEHRLSTGALLAVHAALAIGLAAGALALRDQYHDDERRKTREPEADEACAPRIVRHVRAGRARYVEADERSRYLKNLP
ncbi:hypothetical protein [Polaromonas sp. CG9_12]|uniref:hypothetical protein n=1 Tax=Polaromonas sp. CG_9.11 TaxID=2787730 RepID=UPI0004DDDCD6|nr:lysylphosphatidylglycerol synthetase-like protein (DUF2156 family) [Polaromonas sp. CG_9.11]CDS54277.1 hypothetical protein [Polaromonas sp. CG9_12]